MNNIEKRLFAVVDVETTGGKPIDTKITEIGIVISDGKQILSEYQTLVNPEKRIDWYVTKLTNITNEMVANEPRFDDLADTIQELLKDKIFVAHNVDFDFGILKRQFLEIGKPLDGKRLCTVKSAKKVFQGLSSYSLSNITEYLEIPLMNAHRALDDARATTHLLHKILEQADFDFLHAEIKEQNHIVELPEHWVIKDNKPLDHSSGIIYFHNDKDEIIYIDISKNFQKKIYEVVSGAQHNDFFYKRLLDNTRSLTLDFMDDLFKSELKMINDIQFQRPRYNKPFKAQNDTFAIYIKKDEKSLNYLTISRSKNIDIENIAPIIYSSSFRSAEKLKDKFNHSPEIAQLQVLKKQIYVDEEIMQDIHINQYNQSFMAKLCKDFICPIKDGYYVFNIWGENEVEAVSVENYYIKSWGKGVLENNKVVHFRSEFDFDKNQKVTRKFLSILGKTTYKLISTNANE
ncbi:MAG: 3'-5' exoribonuclease [Chitinophagales bacterium]|nr:3'-5' exoribonuclease [Chitinophagales bacterium]